MDEQNKVVDPLNQKKIEEFEMLTFSLDGKSYGIEVAKIREIMRAKYDITPIPNNDSRIIGIFMPRDEIISCVDLKRCLFGTPDTEDAIKYLIIFVYNGHNVAFTCEDVKDIKRYDKADLSEPPTAVGEDSLVTSIIKVNDDIVNIVDFEKIVGSICGTEAAS